MLVNRWLAYDKVLLKVCEQRSVGHLLQYVNLTFCRLCHAPVTLSLGVAGAFLIPLSNHLCLILGLSLGIIFTRNDAATRTRHDVVVMQFIIEWERWM